jgi:riboflavin transporter FmnP
MANPVRAIAEQFVSRSPTTLLIFGISLSLLDFAALYAASTKEGVLHVSGGIGLLNNYGLFSTLLGNAVFPYVVKKYYDTVSSMRDSRAIVKTAPVEEAQAALAVMIRMRREHRFWVYLMIVIGAIAWLLNVKFHVIDDPEVKWGHKVFDSPDHLLTFIASRFHNFYTWLIIIPLLAHVMISSSIQLKRGIETASREGALTYDLLNPDQRGGFGFVDSANIIFNVIAALAYVQVTLHIGTFERMNTEHVIAYVTLTVLLIVINRMFLGDVYATIKTLRMESLNKVKDNVYNNDKMSFEILKYCYERRVGTLSVINFAIKAGAIVIPWVLKLWPVGQSIQRSLR